MKSVVIYYTLLDGFHKSGGRNKSGEGGGLGNFSKISKLEEIIWYSRIFKTTPDFQICFNGNSAIAFYGLQRF